MATKKKALQAAAGWAASQGGVVAPEGVSFDGDYDYLSRSSDLTGNADGKTFTFSAWIYVDEIESNRPWTIYGEGYAEGIQIGLNYNGGVYYIYSYAYNTSGGFAHVVRSTDILASTNTENHIKNTWTHVLVSINNGTASKMYVNDVDVGTYNQQWTSDNINFTSTQHLIGADPASPSSYLSKGRIAHVYLDYTYRDLDTESNRRLFITDDLKPADDQASLSPIIYLPLTDADTAGTNAGTGGDFTVNGTLDTAQRGPNQDNCVASEFDGSADYLSRTSISGAVDSKQILLNFVFNANTGASGRIFTIKDGSAEKIDTIVSSGFLYIDIYKAGTTGFAANTKINITENKSYNLTVSLDLTNTSKRHVILNGKTQSVTWTNYSSTNNIDFTTSDNRVNSYFNGSIGELYLDNTYTDLSTDNPFWDADANRPKPVRQVLDETGNTPLIAMPLAANNAGLNLGTGGDFTVNSGPYTGARGGSEYWARSAYFANSTSNYLSGTVNGASSSDTSYSFACTFYSSGFTTNRTLFSVGGFAPLISYNQLFAWLGTGSGYVQFSGTSITENAWHTVLFARSGGTYKVYIDGNAHTVDTGNCYNYTASATNLTTTMYVGTQSGTANINGNVGALYFVDEYIDFGQESNRNKFIDQLGYPKDLTSSIASGDIPTPQVYLKFNDPDALGTNDGSGSDFTKSGSVIVGADYSK